MTMMNFLTSMQTQRLRVTHTSDDEFSVQQLDEVIKDVPFGPERLACFAHTL